MMGRERNGVSFEQRCAWECRRENCRLYQRVVSLTHMGVSGRAFFWHRLVVLFF